MLLSSLLSRKCFWTDAAIRTMTSGAIIVYFNVFENSLAQFFSDGKTLTMDDFHLQGLLSTLIRASWYDRSNHRNFAEIFLQPVATVVF